MRWRRVVLTVVPAGFIAFAVVSLTIGRQVGSALDKAQLAFPAGGVTALIGVAGSADVSVAQRNRAIWALGQLGAGEALPTLKALARSDGCEHESAVCQREVAKAIALCEGRSNAGALIWRHGRLAKVARRQA